MHLGLKGVPWRSALATLVVGALAAGSLTFGASGAAAVDTPVPVAETPGTEDPGLSTAEKPDGDASAVAPAPTPQPSDEESARGKTFAQDSTALAEQGSGAEHRANDLPVATAQSVSVNQFPDKALRDCINGIITSQKKEIDQLVSISCPNKGIVEITGMQLAKKAKTIAFQGNSIYRIDELLELPELVDLDLTNNKIYNLPKAPSTSKLETLWLRGNLMKELYEIQWLPRLKVLSVGENPNLEILQHLNYQKLVPGATAPALKEIYASDAPKLTNAFLPDLKLRKFEASRTAISDFSNIGWSVTEGPRKFVAYDVKVVRPDVFVGERFGSIVSPGDSFQKSNGVSLTGIPWRSSGLSDDSGYHLVEKPVGSFTAKYTFRPHFVQSSTSPLTADSGGSTLESGKVVATEVTGMDPGLKQCVQDFYGLPTTSMVTSQAIAALTSLNCADEGIAHLKGLEHAANLKELHLQANPITSLSPLASLTALEDVNLAGTRVKDFSSIGWRTSTKAKPVTLKADALSIDLGSAFVGSWLGKTVTAPPAWGDGTVTANSATSHVSPPSGGKKQLLPLVANANWRASFSFTPPATGATAPYFSDTSTVAGTYRGVVSSSGATVPDAALKACIWKALDVPTGTLIAKGSLAGLQTLECPDKGIADLTGLEHATNLTVLDMSNNDIVNANPISKLTSLKDARFADNGLTDMSQLAGLTNLTHLYVHGNKHSSVDQLEKLVNLQTLWSGANSRITSVDRLGALPKLNVLNLGGATSLERVNLPNSSLSLVTLSNTHVSDFSKIGWRVSTAENPVSLVADALNVSLGEQSVGARFGHTLVAPKGWVEGSVRPPTGTTYAAATAGAAKTFLATTKSANWATPFDFKLPAAGGSAPFFSADSKISGAFTANIAGADVVVPDTALQACVRAAIGVPEATAITVEALKQITAVDCAGKGVQDLTGLELAANVKSLKLANNQITDISPLVGLKQLTSLVISGQNVALAPATVKTKYPNVVRDLQGNPIAPANTTYYFAAPEYAFQYPDSLAGQTRNESWSKLVAIGTAQATFSGTTSRSIVAEIAMPDAKLRACVNEQLAQLTQSSRASDRLISASEMKLITELSCTGEGVTDLTGIEHATKMATLNIASNQIVSLQPLSGLASLASLTASGNQVASLAPIAGLTKLVTLDVSQNQVADLGGLSGNLALTSLKFSGNKVTDISVISVLSKLALVDADGQQIAGADAFVGMPDANPITGSTGTPVPPTAASTAYRAATNDFLYTVENASQRDLWTVATGVAGKAYSGTITRKVRVGTAPSIPVTDPALITCIVGTAGISPPQEMLDRLTTLDCDSKGIASLSGIEGAVNLKSLSINNNKLTDLSPLSGLAKLTLVAAAGQTVSQPDAHTGVAAVNPVVGIDGQPVVFTSPEYQVATNSFVFTQENLTREDAWTTSVSVGGLSGTFAGKLVRKVIKENIDKTPVSIPDAKLKACIASHLNQGTSSTITRHQMSQLATLDCAGKGVTSLQGLAYAGSLKTLKLSGNRITNIAPLFGLDSLKTLDLKGQQLDAGMVETGRPLANPVIGLYGKPVTVGWSKFYVKNSNTFVYGVPNPKQQESWKVDVVIGSAATQFSGVLRVNVKPKVEKPKPVPWKFDDVKNPKQPFYSQIYWMANANISTGTVTRNASGKIIKRMYLPKDSVSREAMAAFLYRYAGSPKFSEPSKSPFVDLKPGDKFYKEITWLNTQKITGGVKTPKGLAYKPKDPVTREAMAAFLFRMSKEKFTPSKASAFRDVKSNHKFYKEIAWMAKRGISTGTMVDQKKNIKEYRPSEFVTREAMAAFLNRHDQLK